MRGFSRVGLLVLGACLLGPGLLVAQTGPATGPLGQEYRLVVDDRIQVVVEGHDELGRTYSVPPAGEVSFPPLGRVNILGRTTRQLEEEITTRLKQGGQLQDPVVFILINSYSARKAFLIGAVTSAVDLPVHGGYGILEILAMAGISPDRTDYRNVTIMRRRPGGEPFRFAVNVNDVLMGGDFRKNVVVMADDIIFLPSSHSVAETAYVYVLGQVKRVGRYAFNPTREPLTLSQLVVLSGGLEEFADEGSIRIIRKEGNRTIGIEVDFDEILDLEIQDLELRHNDLVYVPESPI